MLIPSPDLPPLSFDILKGGYTFVVFGRNLLGVAQVTFLSQEDINENLF